MKVIELQLFTHLVFVLPVNEEFGLFPAIEKLNEHSGLCSFWFNRLFTGDIWPLFFE